MTTPMEYEIALSWIDQHNGEYPSPLWLMTNPNAPMCEPGQLRWTLFALYEGDGGFDVVSSHSTLAGAYASYGLVTKGAHPEIMTSKIKVPESLYVRLPA